VTPDPLALAIPLNVRTTGSEFLAYNEKLRAYLGHYGREATGPRTGTPGIADGNRCLQTVSLSLRGGGGQRKVNYVCDSLSCFRSSINRHTTLRCSPHSHSMFSTLSVSSFSVIRTGIRCFVPHLQSTEK
jgi:hypothetical protein